MNNQLKHWWWMFVCLIALCVGLVLVFFVLRTPPVYRAYSGVMMRGFTNVVLTRSFEDEMLKSIPGILQLKVTPEFRTPIESMAWLTNKVGFGVGSPSGVEISIIALGSSPLQAQRSADAAADQVRDIVFRQYHVNSIGLRVKNTDRWTLLDEYGLRVRQTFKKA